MKPELRLFALRDLANGRVIPNLFFASKQEAKTKRAELGDTTHCVTYGPDHRLFRG